MLTSVKSEFLKLLTTRSTYYITLLGLLLTGGLLDFYAQGYRGTDNFSNPHFVEGIALLSITFMSIFSGIVVLLLVTHEYRYNTVMYSITSSNSRTKSLIAKAIVVTSYTLAVGALITVIGPVLAWLGLQAQGVEMASQTIDYWNIAWRSLFYTFGNSMAAFIMAFIIRNQIGAILTYFVAAGTIEELLTFVLKDNSKYLPFRALNEVVNFSAQTGEVIKDTTALTVGENALIFSGYMIIGMVVTWYLFVRRDAN